MSDIDVAPVARVGEGVVEEAPLPRACVLQEEVVREVVFVVQPDHVVAAAALAGVAPVDLVAEVPDPRADRPVVQDVVDKSVDAAARRRAEDSVVPYATALEPGGFELRDIRDLVLQGTRRDLRRRQVRQVEIEHHLVGLGSAEREPQRLLLRRIERKRDPVGGNVHRLRKVLLGLAEGDGEAGIAVRPVGPEIAPIGLKRVLDAVEAELGGTEGERERGRGFFDGAGVVAVARSQPGVPAGRKCAPVPGVHQGFVWPSGQEHAVVQGGVGFAGPEGQLGGEVERCIRGSVAAADPDHGREGSGFLDLDLDRSRIRGGEVAIADAKRESRRALPDRLAIQPNIDQWEETVRRDAGLEWTRVDLDRVVTKLTNQVSSEGGRRTARSPGDLLAPVARQVDEGAHEHPPDGAVGPPSGNARLHRYGARAVEQAELRGVAQQSFGKGYAKGYRLGDPVVLGDLLEGKDAFLSRGGGHERKERGQQKGAAHDAISSRRPVGLQPDAGRIPLS